MKETSNPSHPFIEEEVGRRRGGEEGRRRSVPREGDASHTIKDGR
jgi:hypothetical protein